MPSSASWTTARTASCRAIHATRRSTSPSTCSGRAPGSCTCTASSASGRLLGGESAALTSSINPRAIFPTTSFARSVSRVHVPKRHERPVEEIVPLGGSTSPREKERDAGAGEREREERAHVDGAARAFEEHPVRSGERRANAIGLLGQLAPGVGLVDGDAVEAAQADERLHQLGELNRARIVEDEEAARERRRRRARDARLFADEARDLGADLGAIVERVGPDSKATGVVRDEAQPVARAHAA